MSVINQMLKDLDKRQSDQQVSANMSAPLTVKASSTKFIIFTVVIIIILNIIGLFGWQLYSENQQLKQQAQSEKIVSNLQAKPIYTQASSSNSLSEDFVPELTTPANDNSLEKIKTLSTLTDTKPFSRNEEQPKATSANSSVNKDSTPLVTADKIQTDISAKKSNVIVEPIKTVLLDVKNQELMKVIPDKVESSLTISRTQLSPQALVANKITQAEKAMERNDIAKAESLFEEILMVLPSHETARKQLAALWYGKRYYLDAINLLSQGIALAPKEEEMRLMSAKIFYEQEQARQAYNILKPVNLSNSAEVQTLLANISAEINEHESAIFAYRKLIALEPEVGRWWLGVAVSLDSLGKFVPARDAYQQSIASNNLSMSAMQFAQQRLIELGE